ncbi:MAG: methyltransferase domain-containing protein [Candidatus Brocadia sp.]|nr:methyltransferase domain-containing protein [Candidatus Brocadia sp.]
MYEVYEEIKNSFLGEGCNLVPEKYRSNFVNIGGAFEANYIIWKLLQEGVKKGKVLVIGVFGGRDYFGLLLRGYDVYGFDLVDLPGFHKLNVGNVEDELPYPDEEFDGVIMGEILEHLKDDVKALSNVKRILKKDGVLIITVPFCNDKPEYHIRVHTRKSCQRLLRVCGFEVLKIVERPAIWRIPFWVNGFHHLIGWISLKISGLLPHKILLPLWANIEFKVGQIYSPIRHRSSVFGGYYLCKKSIDKEYNYVAMNIGEFSKK